PRRRRHDHEGRGRSCADGVLVAAPRSREWPAARARGVARPRRPARRAPRCPDANGLRRLRGAQAARGGESRLTPAARAVARAARRYRARYATGALCLAAATGFSLAIPWTVKHAIDALARDGAGAALGGYVAVILALAAAHWATRLGSRFATIGAAQRVETDLRDGLYEALQRFPPDFFARHSTGDLMTRASSDVSAVRSLVGFGAISLLQTLLAFAGALAAMV